MRILRLHKATMLAAALVVSASLIAQEPAPPRQDPCNGMEQFSQFDFWVGEWTVAIADGTQAGRNLITKEKGGCLLTEHWTSVRGGTGFSLNYYDPTAGEWVQNWVDGSGSIIDIRGGIEEGSMVLTGTIQYVGNGKVNAFRGKWTLLGDGRVRQFFEESTDGGKSWTTWFEGFYSRQSAP